MSLKGSCFCGHIRYEVDGPVLQVVACHCSLCRSTSGAAFTTYVLVRNEEFTLVSGEGTLADFPITRKMTKYYCASCGTPVFNSNAAVHAGLTMLYLGTLVGNALYLPRIEIFCDDKLAWLNLDDRRAQFPQAFRKAET